MLHQEIESIDHSAETISFVINHAYFLCQKIGETYRMLEKDCGPCKYMSGSILNDYLQLILEKILKDKKPIRSKKYILIISRDMEPNARIIGTNLIMFNVSDNIKHLTK